MADKNFDVLVIGGGPGGYVAAIRAAQTGKSVALAEKENLGGVCLNWGCIPTKSLLRNAEVVRTFAHAADFGIKVDGFSADYAAAQERSRAVSKRLVNGIEYLMKKNKITVFKDTAKFTGPKEVTLEKSKERVSAQNIIVATGSVPFRLPFLNYSMENVLDSKKALQLTKAPESILIIGAGAIGMEFATVFRAYGAKVVVVEMLPRILPGEDEEISGFMYKELIKKGFELHVGTKVVKIENDGKVAKATLEKDGKQFAVETGYVLAAAGVRPNLQGLNIEKAGCRLDAKGCLEVNANMRTGVPGIYAIGDVTGKCALAHAASAQGLKAVEAICGREAEEINYANVPKCTYASPETASAGLTEAAAKAAGFHTGTAVFPFTANGKAISYGEDAGMVKLVYDKKEGLLLGAHMAGAHVTEMIWGIAGYLGLEMTMEEMASVIHPHPTISETILEAAHIACGMPIHI
jgi:dihydrolipoamide dehydrogenase